MSGLIDPTKFVVKSVDLTTGGIGDSAVNVRAMGRSVDERTRSISATWTGLSAGGVYQAPEQGQVYALMEPAVTSAAQLRSAFETMARHLDTYASALDAIRPRLVDLERRAAAFRAEVKDGVQVDASSAKGASFTDVLGGIGDWVGIEEKQVTVPWNEDGESIARNAELLDEYGQLFEEITQATADCANAIGDLVTNSCVATVEAVPAEALTNPAQPMPWGSAVQEDRNCHESVGSGVATFGTDLWDGTRTMVAGYDPSTGEYGNWGLTGQAWGGLGDLVGSTLLMASPAGWVAAGMSLTGNTDNDFHRFMVDRAEVTAGGWGSLIGYDAAAEDPWHAWKEDGVAAGTTAFLNIGTLFIPGAGVAGGAVKLGATGAKIARIAAAGADFAVTGGSWAVRGGLRVFTGLRTTLHLGGDIVPSPGQAAGAAAAAGVRLNPTTLINAVNDAGPSRPATSAPVSDSLGLAPSRTDAPDATAGGHDAGAADTASGGPRTVAADGHGDTPAGAGRPQTTDEASPVPGDAPVAVDSSGTPHPIRTSTDQILRSDAPYGPVLEDVLATRGITPDRFDALVTTPIERLSHAEVTTLLEIREALPAVGPDTVLQKVIPPHQAMDILGAAARRFMEPGLLARLGPDRLLQEPLASIGGFVARAADVAGLSPERLYQVFGLNYRETPFEPTGESMFAVRYRAGGVVHGDAGGLIEPSIPSGPLKAMETLPDTVRSMPDGPERRAAVARWVEANAPTLRHAQDALAASNPFRGNGFGGTGADYVPELTYTYPERALLQEGAELWRIRPDDGVEELAAVLRDDEWQFVVEQPVTR